ncbi:peptidoglycan/LPS O-acetylase OafA/YrhL [Oxalobacteraceae bacterium GrIS 2.11]
MTAKYLGDLTNSRENNLTFIRFICACMVIYGHSYALSRAGGADWVVHLTGYAFSGGVAVDLFFLISGYLVTASIINSGIFKYTASRILRIYPALLVSMTLIVFVLGAAVTTLSIGEYYTKSEVWSYFLDLVMTIRSHFFLPGVFKENIDAAVNGSIWSVLIEVRCYLILALVYLMGLLKTPARFNAFFFISLIVFWMNPNYLPAFASGTTASHVCFLFSVGVFIYMNRSHVPVGAYSILIAVLFCAVTLGTPGFQYAYIFLLVSMFLSCSFGTQFSWFDRIGDYSFGIYLYGWPIQQLVVHFKPDVSPMMDAVISIPLAILLGFLSWTYIENPVMQMKPQIFSFFATRTHIKPFNKIFRNNNGTP